ncbi:polycystin-1-like protein 2 [Branchiostoma floridae x Branchiostoma belcheri]
MLSFPPAVVDTVSLLMESGGLEAVSEDEEDIAALHRLPPRKREEFRQKMKKKLREKQERQWAIQREVTRELQRNLDSIADALLDSKGGAGRVELGSRAVQMVLGKTSGGRLGGAAVSAHAGGVTFPGPHALHEGGVAEDAAMKVVGYDRNPYVWDESAKDIKSSDLSEDITVVLKNAPDMFPAPRLVKYSPFPNDTMVFRTFSARRNQSYGVLVSLVAPYPGAVMYGKLGDFPNETDYDFKKEFSWDDFIAKTVPPHGDVHITYTVLQPDTAGDNGTEEYTIGLQVDSCPPEGCPYSVDISRLDCVFWDPGIDAELGSWKGTAAGPASTLAHTVCLCNHLTGFGTSGGTEPNRINFKTVFSKFQDLVNNYAVWTTMVVVMGMYLVMIYPARRKDKADEQKWSIKNVHGNRRRHRSRFLVRVDTGHDWGAGTRSKVGFVLTGDKGSTGPRSFQQNDMIFQTGGVNTFLLTTPQKLGSLTSLTVWHDNSGEGRHASWFLERVEVTDLQTNKKTQFVCNDWLGVEHGDGCLKRTLPPTAETDVSLGQRFNLKLREKFKDGHVWLSVVTSRPKSYFSRVQRLSCCVCLLFCKMITSAMWFKGAGQGASSVVLTIGSVELTAETLLVSLWTTLQVFPVNFIIVQIFRRCRPKGVPTSSGLQLPYWSVYVAWTLLVLTTLASGFFLMLYSMEWGRDKSIQWLTAFGLSFLQSMVVFQPAEKSDTDDKDEDVEAGKRQPVEETLPAEPLTGWSELEETEQLKQQRAERKNWLQLTNNGRQCILGIIIITAAILMVHEVWSPSAPAINQGLKAGFSNGTNLVKTQKDVLPWLEGAFARKLYPTHQYNGDALDWRDSMFISGMPAYRVGPVRLGQFRARTGMCDVAKPALHANKTCVMPYVSGIAGEAAASFPESSPETFSHVLHGTMGSYGGPGYRVNLGEMQAEMMETLRILKANRWIDPYTTALVLDLTLYHVNANLFSTVCVLFEFPPSAGAIATLKVSTFPLTAQGMAPTILFVAKAVFVACLLYVIIRLVKNARKEGRSFILQVWTVVEVASIVTSLYVIGAMASKDAFVGKAKSLISQELQKEQRSFVELTDVAFWTDQFTAAVAMVIWLNLVKLCSLLRVSARVRTYLDTLINIRMQLLGSLAIFILTVMGFSVLGYLLFCPYVETFRSLSAATVGLTLLPWGEVSYDVLATPSELVGPLFLFTSGFTIMYLLLSFTAGVFVSATSAMMGEKGRGKVAAARQRKNRLAKAAREARAAVPPARNTRHYCNCDETNKCFGQTHTAETQV